jgi:hypothetical protein
MEWLIKFLLIIGIIYFVGYFFFRVVLPWMLKRFVRKVAKKMNVQFDEPVKKKKEGQINIDYIPETNSEPSAKPHDGEYVDYEEIK